MYSDKVSLDKFYTKEDIAIDCINKINLTEYDLVIEPSAGSGAFFNNLYIDNKIGLDLHPESSEIIEMDWFDYQIDKKYKNVLIIGNPPFGKRNKLSQNFLKHASSFDNVKTIAFILPDVYNKHTLQKAIPTEFRLKNIIRLPKNSFEVDGVDYHVPCSFFIFDRSEGKCLRFNPMNYIDTKDWIYGTKNDYDFFVMGASLKTVKEEPEETNRGYYIKVRKNISINKVKNNFINGDWNGFSSANGGVSWFTKPEVVKAYREQYE